MMITKYPISEAPPAEAAVLVIMGLAFLFIGMFNPKFYWLEGRSLGDREAPLWAGRAMFGFTGVLFFAIGAYNLWLR